MMSAVPSAVKRSDAQDDEAKHRANLVIRLKWIYIETYKTISVVASVLFYAPKLVILTIVLVF